MVLGETVRGKMIVMTVGLFHILHKDNDFEMRSAGTNHIFPKTLIFNSSVQTISFSLAHVDVEPLVS